MQQRSSRHWQLFLWPCNLLCPFSSLVLSILLYKLSWIMPHDVLLLKNSNFLLAYVAGVVHVKLHRNNHSPTPPGIKWCFEESESNVWGFSIWVEVIIVLRSGSTRKSDISSLDLTADWQLSRQTDIKWQAVSGPRAIPVLRFTHV